MPLSSFEAATRRDSAVATLRAALAEVGLDEAALDSRLLAAAALGIPPLALLTDGAAPLGPEGAARLAAFAARRLAREPVARILGTAEFRGLPFRLSRETLVPRPDTETLVDAVLAARPHKGDCLRILDLGTGTGCVLVALLHERSAAFGIGLDRSAEAAATARDNARLNGVSDRAAFLVGDWDDALAGPFDLVVSNPPYIPDAVVDGLAPEVARHDPRLALAGGPDGLAPPRRVLAAASRLLAPGGLAAIEFGYDQATAMDRLAAEAGFAARRPRRDLGGHVRCMVLARHEADLGPQLGMRRDGTQKTLGVSSHPG